MPVNIPDNLPAIDILKEENIFIMEERMAIHQDIRPLRIALCNLMPLKIITETDFIRLLSNSPLQIELDFFYMDKHDSKNTSKEHLNIFYKTFDQIKHNRYDGLIITGAPVEHLPFEQVDYWDDLMAVMAWSKTNVTNTMHVCWGAQAGLYYHYGIEKYPLPKKLFGVFEHQVTDKKMPLFRGFDDLFLVPHSRYTETRLKDIIEHPFLMPAVVSEKAGVHVIVSQDNKQVFVTGHFEYNPDTLKTEYIRDKAKGLNTDLPENYFPNNDPDAPPLQLWRANANLFYINWLNYYVYQETPYEWV
jgi:homoserine O-succinyltransferase/O-acetyltransferase